MAICTIVVHIVTQEGDALQWWIAMERNHEGTFSLKQSFSRETSTSQYDHHEARSMGRAMDPEPLPLPPDSWTHSQSMALYDAPG